MRALGLVFLAAALPLFDCSSGEGPALAIGERLEQSFPGFAAKITGGESRPSRTARGIELDAPRGRAELQAILPERAGDAVVMRARGLDVRVREIDARGTAEIAGSAVAYDAHDAGGRASLWAATPRGCEEWLVVPEGVSGEIAAFEIAGARPVLADRVVLLVDAAGAPRIVVAAPSAVAIGGAPLAVRLGVRGDRVTVSIDPHAGPALVDPSWTPATSMATARMRHTATLLPSGKVLVAGGVGGAGELASAEIYDPAIDMWSPASSMAGARAWHEAALLANGKVLAVGGEKGGSALATAEIYDPGIDTWSPAMSMSAARFRFSATELGSGAVLAVGGFSAGGTIGAAEIYDPGGDVWSPASPVAERGAHRATLLPSGKVLVSGGLFVSGVLTSTLADAWLYDPGGNIWLEVSSLAAARFDHTATLLQSGHVFVAGGSQSDGFTTSNLASAELYNPAGDAWSPAGTLSTARAEHAAALLADGRVIVAGGDASGATADLYDPVANAIAPTTAMIQKRLFATASALPNGKALVAGGEAASPLASSEVFSPPAAAGVACTLPADCASGFCVSHVCCATPCAGACQACSVAAGAVVDGVCGPSSGGACDDGNACTQGDLCAAGTCSPGVAIACQPSDGCHAAGTCDPKTGTCGAGIALPDATVCDDSDACTTGETCVSGVCAGGLEKTCGPASDQCHAPGACDPKTGMCGSAPLVNGTPCNDGNGCTPTDTCVDGVCMGTDPGCSAVNDCQFAGECDPMTGICSMPNKPDGTPCGEGTCTGGMCIGPPASASSGIDMSSSGPGGGGGSGGSGSADETGSDGGCGCIVAGEKDESGEIGIGILFALAAMRRRRRRRTPSR